MNTVMTKDDVFEAVLEKYETAKASVIWEYSGRIEEDITELSQEIKELRERYYTAESPFATDTNVADKECHYCKHNLNDKECKECNFESLV